MKEWKEQNKQDTKEGQLRSQSQHQKRCLLWAVPMFWEVGLVWWGYVCVWKPQPSKPLQSIMLTAQRNILILCETTAKKTIQKSTLDTPNIFIFIFTHQTFNNGKRNIAYNRQLTNLPYPTTIKHSKKKKETSTPLTNNNNKPLQ